MGGSNYDLTTGKGRFFAHVNSYFSDHALVRAFFPLRSEIAPSVWRAGQPTVSQITWYKKRGIKTIVNLRGPTRHGSFALEEEACREQGLTLVNLKMSSRRAPRIEEIFQLKEIFETVEYPVLFHCKSGADRTGFVAVLYLILQQNMPVEEALKHLSLRYLHIKTSKTGILDAFFEAYLQSGSQDFLHWVQNEYNPELLMQSFKPTGFGQLITDRILRRE